MEHKGRGRAKYIEEMVEQNREDMKEIKHALIGDEYGNEGLVHKVKKHDKYIKQDQKVKWGIAGAGALIGVVAKYGKTIKEWLLS